MSTNTSVIISRILISGILILFFFPAIAQKEYKPTLVSQDQINKITELLKPVKEQLEKRLNEDKTGNYKSYQESIRKLNASKRIEEKKELSTQILKKYTPFFTEVWASAKIDEKLYQQKIRSFFPEIISSSIQFGSFLNFSMSQSSYKPTPPAPAPAPKDICIDVCPVASGEITGSTGLISGNGGQYGNCFLKTSAWAVVAGGSYLDGQLKNNISIPGTFPDDSRKLHVRISYDIKLEATAFSFIGLGSAQASIQTYQTTESLYVGSPFFCAVGKTVYKTINEDYILDKKDFAKSMFKSSAQVIAMLISANWSVAEINSIKWTICEEK